MTDDQTTPQCTGPFRDARDCPVHRPVTVDWRERHHALLAALDALVMKWERESAAGRIYAARLAAELATHRELT